MGKMTMEETKGLFRIAEGIPFAKTAEENSLLICALQFAYSLGKEKGAEEADQIGRESNYYD